MALFIQMLCLLMAEKKKENKGKEEVPNRRTGSLVVRIRHQGALLG